MKNTLENKEKYFAAHLNQNVVSYTYVDWEQSNTRIKSSLLTIYRRIKQEHEDTSFSCWIELTPLSEITDEDAVEVAKLRGYVNDFSITTKKNGYWISWDKVEPKFIYWNQLMIDEVDYLRYKGYALPYNGLSVEELINRGWLKLKKK